MKNLYLEEKYRLRLLIQKSLEQLVKTSILVFRQNTILNLKLNILSGGYLNKLIINNCILVYKLIGCRGVSRLTLSFLKQILFIRNQHQPG